MAARANSKGYLRLSLVSCPIALYPATSESEKVRFHQLHKQTGNRIRYLKVDADTGKQVDSDDIVKAYEVSKANTSKSPTRISKRFRLIRTARSTSISSCRGKRLTIYTTFGRLTSLPRERSGRTLL